MDLIGNIIPMVNDACCQSSQSQLIRQLVFYVTTAREFFLVNTHRLNSGSLDQTSKDFIKYDANGYRCCDNNDALYFTSKEPFELDINWDDGSEIEHVVATERWKGRYDVKWYSYDSDYIHKYTGNGSGENGAVTDGKKDEMVESWAFRNHIFQGQKKEHTVVMTITKGTIYTVNSYYIRLGKMPLLQVPELTLVDISECPMDSVSVDSFLYCPNLTTLGLRSIGASHPLKFPDSLWQLTKLQYLYIDSFVSNDDPDVNGLRNISKLKSLKTLTCHGNTKYYIKEFNDLPNLNYLKITHGFSKDYHDNLFTHDNITEINPKISTFEFMSCWQDDSADEDYTFGPILNNIKDLSHIAFPSVWRIPKGKNTIIPEWCNRVFNISTITMNKAYGNDPNTSSTIDLGVKAFYERAIKFGHNRNYIDGEYKGKRNPWYNLIWNLYSQSQPVNHRPSGTYQAPDGFVKETTDGNPSTPMEMIYVLVNNYKWTVLLPPEKNVQTNPADTIKPQSLETSVVSLDDLENIESNIDTVIDYETNPIQVNGRILIIDENGNIKQNINGDVGKIDIYTPDDLDMIPFANEDDAKEYCKENNIEYKNEEA